MKLFKLMLVMVVVSSLGACSITMRKPDGTVSAENEKEEYKAYRPGSIRGNL